MVEADQAYALMGNHEYNAIGFHMKHPETGRPLRPHSDRNVHRHKAFLNEAAQSPDNAQAALDWFESLPIALEISHGYFVHACWEHDLIKDCQSLLGSQMVMDKSFLLNSFDKGAHEYGIIETLLKGPEIDLSHYGAVRYDSDGDINNDVRIAWWPTLSKDLKDVVLRTWGDIHFSDAIIGDEVRLNTSIPSDKVCFFGHYWMDGDISLQAPNMACIDYSIAKGGKLVCYRWDGETQLDLSKFVSVDV